MEYTHDASQTSSEGSMAGYSQEDSRDSDDKSKSKAKSYKSVVIKLEYSSSPTDRLAAHYESCASQATHATPKTPGSTIQPSEIMSTPAAPASTRHLSFHDISNKENAPLHFSPSQSEQWSADPNRVPANGDLSWRFSSSSSFGAGSSSRRDSSLSTAHSSVSHSASTSVSLGSRKSGSIRSPLAAMHNGNVVVPKTEECPPQHINGAIGARSNVESRALSKKPLSENGPNTLSSRKASTSTTKTATKTSKTTATTKATRSRSTKTESESSKSGKTKTQKAVSRASTSAKASATQAAATQTTKTIPLKTNRNSPVTEIKTDSFSPQDDTRVSSSESPEPRAKGQGRHVKRAVCYRRSKEGCWTCRIRRKKCDEARPSCWTCRKLGIPCEGYAERKPEFMVNAQVAAKYKAYVHRLIVDFKTARSSIEGYRRQSTHSSERHDTKSPECQDTKGRTRQDSAEPRPRAVAPASARVIARLTVPSHTPQRMRQHAPRNSGRRSASASVANSSSSHGHNATGRSSSYSKTYSDPSSIAAKSSVSRILASPNGPSTRAPTPPSSTNAKTASPKPSVQPGSAIASGRKTTPPPTPPEFPVKREPSPISASFTSTRTRSRRLKPRQQSTPSRETPFTSGQPAPKRKRRF